MFDHKEEYFLCYKILFWEHEILQINQYPLIYVLFKNR